MNVPGYDFDDAPIAHGAQGAVWFATRDDGAEVAVKVAAEGKGPAEALTREIAALRAVAAHGVGGVATVLDAIVVNGRPAMVMPRYVGHLGAWLERVTQRADGATLRDVFATLERLVRILGDVHRVALDSGHLVHRDVKPENVFLDANGAMHLGDFGGAMAVEGLRAVDLGLFGTPMWAPLDQILPGRTIPDPTWDTYAACVLLYGAITGKRPAYQADPTELLTARGRELWTAAKLAVEASPEERSGWHRQLAALRRGATAADLVDVTGRGALVASDRAVLRAGVARLGALAGVGPAEQEGVATGLWHILARGLSPLGHPSPPNRWRQADELADELARLGAVLDGRRSVSDLLMLEVGDSPPPRTALRSGFPGLLLAGLAIGCGGVLAVGGFAWMGPDPSTLWGRLTSAPGRVAVPAAEVMLDGRPVGVEAFTIGGTEVDAAEWRLCAAAGACDADLYQRVPDGFPALGLGLADAEAVCKFLGGRLPTEAEWLALAGDGPMPWGDAPATCERAVGLGCEIGDVDRIGGRSLGATPHGARDVAGNAWEWVRAKQGGALMGGDAASPVSELGKGARRVPGAGERVPTAGVRCVFIEPQGPAR